MKWNSKEVFWGECVFVTQTSFDEHAIKIKTESEPIFGGNQQHVQYNDNSRTLKDHHPKKHETNQVLMGADTHQAPTP